MTTIKNNYFLAICVLKLRIIAQEWNSDIYIMWKLNNCLLLIGFKNYILCIFALDKKVK